MLVNMTGDENTLRLATGGLRRTSAAWRISLHHHMRYALH